MVKLTNQGVPADAAADRLQEIYGHGGISMSKILLKLVKDKGLKDYYNKYPVSSVYNTFVRNIYIRYLY